MLCSIFIASTTHNSCPDMTDSPGLTDIDITLPGIGDRRILEESLPGSWSRLVVVSDCRRLGGLRVFPWSNSGSISTKKDSPFTDTSTED